MGPFSTKGAANIPLVVVLIIIGTAFLVVILAFGKKFFTVYCKSQDLSRSSQAELRHRHPRRREGPSQTSLPPLPSQPGEDGRRLSDPLLSDQTDNCSTQSFQLQIGRAHV